MTVIIVVAITALLVSAYVIKGMESRMNEKDFTPDLKESRADREIQEKFTSTYHLSIFARSTDKRDNIITPENMADILEVEKKLYEDETIRANLRSGSTEDVMSVADLLAQIILIQKLTGTVENMTQEMLTSMLQAINETFERYISEGLSENPEAMREEMVGMIALSLPEVENSTRDLLASLYITHLPLIKQNITTALSLLINQSFSALSLQLNSTELSGMSNEEAANYINATFQNFFGALLTNVSTTAGYLLGAEFAGIMGQVVYYATGEVSRVVGGSIGAIFGQALQLRMENLSGEVLSIVENATGEAMGGMGGGEEGEMMEAVNRTVEGIVMNLSVSLGGAIGDALNHTVQGVIYNFTTHLGENLTMAWYLPLESMKASVLLNRSSQENITIALEAGKQGFLTPLPNLVESSLAESNFTVSLSGSVHRTFNSSWDTIFTSLNACYTGLVSGMKGQFMEMASQMAGNGDGDIDPLSFMKALSSLSYDEKKKVFLGGSIVMNLMGHSITLIFERMSEEDLKDFIRGCYLHPTPECKPALAAMNASFTKEFNPPEKIEAVGLMISLSFSDTLTKDDDLATEMERRVDKLVEEHDADSEKIVYTTLGQHLISDEIMDSSFESMKIIFALAIIAVILILLLVYRSFFDLVVSLSALLMAILWTYGFGAILGYVSNPLLIAVPVLIVGLGIDFGIHIVMRYRAEREEGEKPEGAVKNTVGSVGMALLLATFTTVVAFLSNAISPIPALSQFGVLCALGIISSFIIMITLVPASKIIRERRTGKKDVAVKKRVKGVGGTFLDRGLALGAVSSERHPTLVLALAIILTGAGFYSYTQIPTRFDIEDFLPEEVPLAKELRFMIEEYNFKDVTEGSVNVLVKGDVASVDFVNGVIEATNNMADSEGVEVEEGKAKVTSILTLMEDYATYTPGGSDYRFNATFSQMYHSLFTGGVLAPNATDAGIRGLYDWLYLHAKTDVTEVLHRDNNGNYDAAVISVAVAVGDTSKEIYKLRDELLKDVEPLKRTQGVSEVIVTSGPILTQIIMDALNRSQINSIIITLIVSFLALGAVYYLLERSFVLGAITTLPMIFCMAWLFGAMFILGIPLNVLTITIASLTVGLGITYGIHMSHRFAEDMKDLKNPYKAMRRTVTHVGSAIFGAAATTIAGFGLLIFALLPPIKQFGGMTALAILFSFLSAVFVLPSILILWARRAFRNDEEKHGEE